MNRDQLWKIYVDKNPKFLTGPISFTPSGLKKFFDQTFSVAESISAKPNESSPLVDSNEFIDNFMNMIYKK